MRRVDDDRFGLCRTAFANSGPHSNAHAYTRAKTIANPGAGPAASSGSNTSSSAPHRECDACVANGHGGR